MPSKRKSSLTSKSASPKKSRRTDSIESIQVEETVLNIEATEGSSERDLVEEEYESRFIGEPVPDDEARQRWPHRYRGKKGKDDAVSKTTNGGDDTMNYTQAKRHFTRAEVDRVIYSLQDDAHVKADEGQDNYICNIIEMFEAVDGSPYFAAQWYYRAKDTVMKDHCNLINNKRVFFSEVKDDNPLDCLVEKLTIARLPLDVKFAAKKPANSNCDYFCDMMYLVPFSSLVSLPHATLKDGNETDSTISSETDAFGAVSGVKFDCEEVTQIKEQKPELMLLDLYSGCGGMSTGLCLGANLAGVNLVTKWAVDLNVHACESLKLNHPETQVRNEAAEDFLSLLKEWEKLCINFGLIGNKDSQQFVGPVSVGNGESSDDEESGDDDGNDAEVFEVERILGICYGDPKESKKRGLHFKIRWKGYGPDEDTWEPIDGLGDCHKCMKEFVSNGFKSKILPLPGNVGVICGGPPCQGISGFNRFRTKDNPLADPKNGQLVVFMDIVDFLKPRFVLMENVVDLLKFAKGYLGRYALGRLVGMNYQARMGMMAAGAYGLPQFRMRVFMWGAGPSEKLPQYPLPTHNVVVRGVIPVEFESNAVVYDEGQKVELEKELLLGDAITDLPPVENNESRDVMSYGGEPQTEFQRFIRLRKDELLSCSPSGSEHALFDHRPLQLNEDDYQRVCLIPKRKGANFRDLKGVRVRKENNKVEWDPDIERVYLPSGKPLVPDYAMSFINGTSSKPFSRLWWDETVPTVVGRAEPHNQKIMHPLQDRVLTVRENARLQGFPDYYKLIGPMKERYVQIGNAVAVPVARALGYALALAFKGSCGDEPLFTLPKKFPNIEGLSAVEEKDDLV